ncbi:hypothetical protein S40288_04800 [Stachybotrys chartarum IBT 40288]|nr:hypothetical protein S40288_04800 [Stachybotrys chartarum IBT 40288]
MASAQDMEEELQQSVLLSEDAGEYDTADSGGDGSTINAASYNSKSSGQNNAEEKVLKSRLQSDEEHNLSDQDASGDEVDVGVDVDAEGEENDEHMELNGVEDDGDEEGSNTNDDGEDDDDAEADEDEEGVGAVKIKPGDTEDEEGDESDVSDLPSAVGDESEEEDDDDEAGWEEAHVGDEDDDSDTAPPNMCIFCKQDEENDPSEDFEAFLTCGGCRDNAHQQCAREAAAMSEHNDAKRWKCPECYHEHSSGDESDSQHGEDEGAENGVKPASQQSIASAQEGEDANSHSVRNEAVVDDEMHDSSRSLRKRKTSSVEADDNVMSLRKRRRHLSIDLQPGHEDGVDSVQSVDASRPHSARTSRLKVARPNPVTVEKRSRNSLVLKIQVRSGNLKEILSRRKRIRKRTEPATPKPSRPPAARASTVPAHPVPVPVPVIHTPFTADIYSQPFYSFFDKDMDDSKGKPYGGILTEAEADTSKTIPLADDRRRFDQAKQKAEDEWRARILTMQAEAELPTRKSKKSTDNGSQIECIEFGGWEIDTWYAAPYPAEYSRNRVLYICEFCLKYMNSDYVAWRHKLKCATKHPPGDEIYRQGSVSVFEVDGRKNPVYCQNLCLLAKLFLGSKTLYYDVEPFLFYVLCEYDSCGYHFVGYFSKEKRASSQNNVSCILTLPIHQRKGYGNLLIDFSYLLTRVEQKTGSPEKPLSDMGLVSYRNYWRLILCQYFVRFMDSDEHRREGLSVKRISDDTGMTADDVISALEGLRALVRDPQTKMYAFRVDLDYCRQYVNKWQSKGYVRLKPEALAWTPYVMGRSNAVNFELGPPINTIAPREEDEAKLQEGSTVVGANTRMEVDGEDQEAVSLSTEAPVATTNGMVDESAPEPVNSVEKPVVDDQDDTPTSDEAIGDLKHEDEETWDSPYASIPPSRFEVFPPIGGSRRAERTRSSVSRPAVVRTVSSSARPKRVGGSSSSSARRPSASRPKSSSSRRKSGGTGRGPGRWPKGTKKSDYGNAASGPGLPPGWREKHDRLKVVTEGHDTNGLDGQEDQKPTQDEVQVSITTPAAAAGEGGKHQPGGPTPPTIPNVIKT